MRGKHKSKRTSSLSRTRPHYPYYRRTGFATSSRFSLAGLTRTPGTDSGISLAPPSMLSRVKLTLCLKQPRFRDHLVRGTDSLRRKIALPLTIPSVPAMWSNEFDSVEPQFYVRPPRRPQRGDSVLPRWLCSARVRDTVMVTRLVRGALSSHSLFYDYHVKARTQLWMPRNFR
jgi:hypothetical protein